jgi:hypothetical protein
MEANLRQLDREDKRDTTSRTMASRTMRLIDAASIGGTLPGRQYRGSSDLRGPVLRANPSRTFATNVSAEDPGLLACGKCCLSVPISYHCDWRSSDIHRRLVVCLALQFVVKGD